MSPPASRGGTKANATSNPSSHRTNPRYTLDFQAEIHNLQILLEGEHPDTAPGTPRSRG